MQETKEIVRVRFDLEGEEAKKFLKLLAKRGLTQNTQLCRQLLKEAEDQELKGKA